MNLTKEYSPFHCRCDWHDACLLETAHADSKLMTASAKSIQAHRSLDRMGCYVHVSSKNHKQT